MTRDEILDRFHALKLKTDEQVKVVRVLIDPQHNVIDEIYRGSFTKTPTNIKEPSK